MDVYRVRVRMADTPGRLGAVAVALGAFAINIVDVDVHRIDASTSADDLLIELTRPVDLPLIEHVLRQVDCEVLALERVDLHGVGDSVARALELGLRVAMAGGDDDVLTEAAESLVRADWAWIDAASTSTVASKEAARRGTPVQRHERVLAGDSWVLAIPVGRGDDGRVLCLSRERVPFSFTETARVQALLRFASATVPGRR